MIPLQNTDDGRARSLTRLVLPIRFKLSWEQPEGQTDDGWQYREATPEDLWTRVAYFAVDTSYALFRRATWLRLERLEKAANSTWTSFEYTVPSTGAQRSDRTIRVDIDPPVVVLFESNGAVQDAQASSLGSLDGNPSHIGFLCLDIRLSINNCSVDLRVQLEDLITFNEAARCLWEPYAGYTGKVYERVMKQCPRGNYLSLWEAAISHAVVTTDHPGKRWLTTGEMRKRTRDWVSGCSARRQPVSVHEAAPSNPSDIETYTGWLATTDYRAYVWTYAFVDSDHALGREFASPLDCPERFGHWVKFLNVDEIGENYWAGKSVEMTAHQTSAFEQVWARTHTYPRWAHDGSYYGFTPHSGVLLSTASSDLPDYGRHFATLYFDQVLLLLYLRTTAFAFSARVARLAAQFVNGGTPSDTYREAFKRVRQDFMVFSSLYQFPLLSGHQQSVEMYTLARRQMDVDDLFREVREEVDAADRVIAAHHDERVSRNVHDLTLWGLPAAFTVLVLAALGLFEGAWAGPINRHDWWAAVSDGLQRWPFVLIDLLGPLAIFLIFWFGVPWLLKRRP